MTVSCVQLGHSKGKNSTHTHKRVKAGDSLNKILLASQFSQKSINKLISRNKFLKYLVLSPRQLYTINRNSQTRSLSIYLEHSQKLQFNFNIKNKTANVQRVNDGLTTQLEKFSGKIKGSLYSSITSKVNDSIIPYKFQDIFLLFYNLKRDLRPGSHFSFTIEKKFFNKKFIKYGQIVEAELEIKNKMARRVLLKKGKTYSYIGNEDESKRPFYSPVDYQHFTSLYKKRRFHPVRKRYMAHQGIDFGLPQGRSIYSVANGKIIKSGYNRRAGNYVAIKHSKGYVSYYNHLVKRHKDHRIGTSIKAGQTIGWIGCSGSCTKPHLHFAVKKNNRFINPIRLIRSYPYKIKQSVLKVARRQR